MKTKFNSGDDLVLKKMLELYYMLCTKNEVLRQGFLH